MVRCSVTLHSSLLQLSMSVLSQCVQVRPSRRRGPLPLVFLFPPSRVLARHHHHFVSVFAIVFVGYDPSVSRFRGRLQGKRNFKSRRLGLAKASIYVDRCC